MITARRRPSAYRLREHAPLAVLRRAWGAFLRSNRVGRAVVALIVIVLLASSLDGNTELAQERDRADRLQEQRDEVIAWAARNTVRLTIEGGRATVANLAQQFANLPRE